MEVTQEGLEDNTGDKTSDKTGDKTPSQNTGGEKPEGGGNAPTEIKVEVDKKAKPAVLEEKVNLMNDDEVDAEMNEPTEEDIKNQQKAKLGSGNNLNEFRQEALNFPPPEAQPQPENKIVDKDKLRRKAEKWAKALDKGATSAAKIWSGQADNTGLVVSTGDVNDVAEAIFDVFEEYNIDKYLSPILTLGATLYAVYSPVYSNAKASKKKIDAFKEAQRRKKKPESEMPKMRPEFDPAKRRHLKTKGGQGKA